MGIGIKARAAALSILVSSFVAAPASATVLDPNWTETTWISTALGQVTGMAWAPDGSKRLFLTVKTGQVRIVNFGPIGTLVTTPFATISPVYTSSECGVIGLAFDPDFVSNGYVYFFVTVSSGEQQIIRYTDSGGVGVAKTTIVPGLPTAGANHDGGSVVFGRDGKLYWGIGDNGNGTGVNLNLTSLASKIGRAHRDGSTPVDNPFYDGPGTNNDKIFARGFRNPYTSTFQPSTGTLWVDVAGTSYEQVFAVQAGESAGYNSFENNQPAPGPPNFYITPKIKYKTNSTDTRTIPPLGASRSGGVVTFTTTVNHLFRQGELITVSGVTDASFNGASYVTSTPTGTTFTISQAGPDATSGGGSAQTQSIGGAITGGTFFDSTAAAPAYRGNFFFGDYNTGRIMRAVVGPGTTVQSVDYFATGNSNSIDVSVGPDGALYYVGIGGTVKRTAYNFSSQDIIVSQSHVWLDESGRYVFTVRLATAPVVDVNVDIARVAGSSAINVSSGATLTFTPANFADPQAVMLGAAGDAGTDAATFAASSPGLTTQLVEVNSMNGSTVGFESPGRVPDGSDDAPGVPLTVNRNSIDSAQLDLDWGPGCGTGSDYSVHVGTIGTWYSHDKKLCTTGGSTAASLTPGLGDEYYLIVPLDITREGSYGVDSANAERPRSTTFCQTGSNTTACP